METQNGNGGSSRTTLMQASDGKLYGMNSLGGSHGEFCFPMIRTDSDYPGEG